MSRGSRAVILPVLLVLSVLLPACAGSRIIVDVVPAADAITETAVLEDEPGGFFLFPYPKVAMIDVSGLISSTGRSGVLGPAESPVARFTESLRKAAEDPQVRAVIVRINSPGGTVTASDVMHRELTHFREHTGRPVVVLMGDVAASGGYYLACAADAIVAHPTTITGSIGVIIQTVNFSEGMRRIGIRADSITSGPNKAAGSPFEPMTAEHRALLQGIVNDFYANFIDVVKDGRAGRLDEGDIDRITDGRVITGVRAAEAGLVDAVGDLRDAFALAKTRAGLDRAQLVRYHRPIEYVGSAYAQTPAAGGPLVQLNVGAAPGGGGSGAPGGDPAAFYYLWDPTVW